MRRSPNASRLGSSTVALAACGVVTRSGTPTMRAYSARKSFSRARNRSVLPRWSVTSAAIVGAPSVEAVLERQQQRRIIVFRPLFAVGGQELGYLPGEVVPGISSLQVAFARLKLPLTRAAIVSAHGKDHIRAVADAKKEVLAGRVVFLIADPAFKVGALAAALPPRIRIAVCEDLGYPAERIAVGTAAEPPTPRGDLFVVVAGDF